MAAAAAAAANRQRAEEEEHNKNAEHHHQPRQYEDDEESLEALDEILVAPAHVLPNQDMAFRSYMSTPVQVFVAVLIFLNFFVSAVQAQFQPSDKIYPGTTAGLVFYILEWFFGLIFTVELVWNMYGSWFLSFWKSGWNWFDFIIVAISLMSLTLDGLPGIGVLRLFRAFRVFRLFKRIESLRMIIEGVLASLPGVMNAFLVLGILMGIWSIMGVEFFHPESADPKQETGESFVSFMDGMFSMWQVMTMDSWASGIARPLIYDHGLVVAVPFFVSFTFIAGIVMMNVVVAILLDKYLSVTQAADKKKEEKRKLKEEKEARKTRRMDKGNASKNGSKTRGSERQSPDTAKTSSRDSHSREEMVKVCPAPDVIQPPQVRAPTPTQMPPVVEFPLPGMTDLSGINVVVKYTDGKLVSDEGQQMSEDGLLRLVALATQQLIAMKSASRCKSSGSQVSQIAS